MNLKGNAVQIPIIFFDANKPITKAKPNPNIEDAIANQSASNPKIIGFVPGLLNIDQSGWNKFLIPILNWLNLILFAKDQSTWKLAAIINAMITIASEIFQI